jgi:hypothetical protein
MNAAAESIFAPSATANRFIDNGDDTITDTRSNLMWSKATLCESEVNQHEAARICGAMDLAGHTDWRLPTVEELFALADRTKHCPAIDTDAFPDTKSDWYWTGTVTAWALSSAWLVSFSNGDSYYCRRDYSLAFVRAVRSLPAGQ